MKTKLRLRVEAIEAARKGKGWTQVKFAEEGEFSHRRYANILRETREGGFPDIGTALIGKWCGALDCNFWDLFEQVSVRE